MKKIIRLIISISILFIGCEFTTKVDNKPIVNNEDGQITIEDRTGKIWDITHAVYSYGFKAANFQFGAGPFAIPPINDPVYIEKGDRDFPQNHETFLMIGTDLNGFTRAYPLSVLSAHEIVNEKFGEDHVSVAY